MMNAYNKKGTQFLKAIKKLVKDEKKENCDVLFKSLDNISLKKNVHLGLKVAVHEGMGDRSSFYTYKGDKDPYGKEEQHPLNRLDIPDIFPNLNVEKSEMGAWQIYLLYMSPTVLPWFWHGGYIKRDYFFNLPDTKQVKIVPFHAEEALMIPTDEIPEPTVTADENKFIVNCTYWNDWEGLVRETVRVKFLKSGKVKILKPHFKVLIPYHCGICF